MNLRVDRKTVEFADHLISSQRKRHQPVEHVDKKEAYEIIMPSIKYARLMRESWHVETGQRVRLETAAALVTALVGSTWLSRCILGKLPLPEEKCIKIKWASSSLLSNNACSESCFLSILLMCWIEIWRDCNGWFNSLVCRAIHVTRWLR